MAIYRVGPEGATVLNSEGRFVMRLRPGHVVVPGLVAPGVARPGDELLPPPPRRRRPSRAAYETKPIRPRSAFSDQPSAADG